MTALLARTLVAVMLFVATLTASFDAAAAPKWAEADQHFRHGVQLFKESNYAAALVEFQRAYDIDPKYQVLYNIGESYYQLQDYANARKTLKRYLEDGGTKIAIRRRKEVEDEIVTLTGRVATLTVTTNEAGASVTIDDVAVGTTPLEPLTVSAGRRRVTASIAGRAPVTKIVDLAGRDKQTLALEIPALPAPVEKERRPPPPQPSIIPPVVAWSGTGVLVTSAVITGVLALSASSDLKDELERFPGNPDALSEAKSSAFELGVATDILIGTSVLAAGLSIYFTIEWAALSDTASSKPAPSGRIKVFPGGVAVQGTF